MITPMALASTRSPLSGVDFVQVRNLTGLFCAIFLVGYPQSIVLALSKGKTSYALCIGITNKAFRISSIGALLVVAAILILANTLSFDSMRASWMIASVLSVPPLIFLSLYRAIALAAHDQRVFNLTSAIPAILTFMCAAVFIGMGVPFYAYWSIPLCHWIAVCALWRRLRVPQEDTAKLSHPPSYGLYISLYSGMLALPAPYLIWRAHEALSQSGSVVLAMSLVLWGAILFPVRAFLPHYLAGRSQMNAETRRKISIAQFPAAILLSSILFLLIRFQPFDYDSMNVIRSAALPIAVASVPLFLVEYLFCELLFLEKKAALIFLAILKATLYLLIPACVGNDYTSWLYAISIIELIVYIAACILLSRGLKGCVNPGQEQRA